MSLFSSRVWWEAQPGNEEEFDAGGFCVANIDNDSSGASYAVGLGVCVWRYFLNSVFHPRRPCPVFVDVLHDVPAQTKS
jgi:hypothetical protein